jgi:FtsP/CotA-like multicopper oxidase with cupredoxin domain
MAAVYYDGADSNAVPTTNTTITKARIETCVNDPLSQQEPLCPISAETKGPITTQELHFNITNNGTAFVWTVNDITFRGDYTHALLYEQNQGTLNPKPEWNVFDFGSNGTIRIVMYNHFPQATHPMHLHGHDFQIVSEGVGIWDGTITNPQNPARRDVQVLGKARPGTGPAYTVIQFEADNPGVWPLHCHVAWHVSAGLYINVLERPADIKKMNIPAAIPQTCKDWAVFTGSNVVNQIDSGL